MADRTGRPHDLSNVGPRSGCRNTGVVTQLIEAAQSGDQAATSELLPIVYQELRSLARHQLAQLAPGQTLQPTALVHEAYLRLVGNDDKGTRWEGRRHFFGAAAQAMRNILVDQARRKHRLKHGGGRLRQAIDPDHVVVGGQTAYDCHDSLLIALDEALDDLERDVGTRAAEVVMLRYFVGLTVPQVAASLGVTSRTVDRDWRFARAWLHTRLVGVKDDERK